MNFFQFPTCVTVMVEKVEEIIGVWSMATEGTGTMEGGGNFIASMFYNSEY